MSIEKLSVLSQTVLEAIPFAQISNQVIEFIKDNDAFRIWAFCLSKSMNWTVYKDFTEKVCGVGNRKGDYVWSYLKRCGLIDYERVVDPVTRKFIRTDIKILNGSKFNPDEPFIRPKTTPAENADMGGSTPAESTPALSAAAEMYPLLNKDITNKDLLNKDKSFCVSREEQKKHNAKKHDWADRHREMKQPASGDNLTGESASPYRRIGFSSPKNNQKKHDWVPSQSYELKQTAKFWGPGHPDWERLNLGKVHDRS